jgi:hypothetical protein
MTDYHPLIARAVEGLAKNTGEARRALYERARAALVAQLRGVEPALSESEITKERLALEEAIRKVESDAARKALSEPRSQSRPEPKFELRQSATPPRSPLGDAEEPNPFAAMSLRRERSGSAAGDPFAGRGEARRTDPPQSPPQGGQTEEPSPPAKQTARDRILEARAASRNQDGLMGLRSVVNEVDGLGAASARAAQSARDTRDSYAPAARQRPPQADDFTQPAQLEEEFEPQLEDEFQHDDNPAQLRGLEPHYEFPDEQLPPPPRSARPQPPPPPAELDEEYEEPRPRRSYRGVARTAALLIILVGVAATGWLYQSNIASVYQFFAHIRQAPSNQIAQTPSPQNKFPGRVPQDQIPGQAPATAGAPGSQSAPEVAQHAVLYEADPNDPQGKRFPGSVIWRTETVSPGPGLAPELVVRADIAIPERQMTVTWSLRRNTDKALPASHTIEVMFNLPADFPGGGIANVPGILMKDTEEVRGMPLAGLAVKVTNGFFLIGLNAADEEMQRNMQLLKDRGWFDVLLVYTNGGRAILTMEKGAPGDHAFADAFAAWGQ